MAAYKWELADFYDKNIFYKSDEVFYQWYQESHGAMLKLTDEGDDQFDLITVKLKDTLIYINMKTWLHKIFIRTNIHMSREKEDILIEAICENENMIGNIKKHIYLQAFEFLDEHRINMVEL
jgi:aminoglycoside/choline kinase family phosphotransferase